MKKNASLVEMYIWGNPISGKCGQLIVQALQHNTSLQELWLSFKHPEDREKVRLSADGIKRKEKIMEYETLFDEHALGIFLMDGSS